MINIGDKAPDFCLLDTYEKEVCLSDYLGKWVVLYFYPKDNTSGCTIEAIDFSEELSSFSRYNAAIIGVSPDSTKSHQNFVQQKALRIQLLSDPDHKALNLYGAWQPKKLYEREFMGVQRSTFLIDPNGAVVHVWSNVNAFGHAETVRDKLFELQTTA